MKRKGILITSLCLSAMTLSFLIGTKSNNHAVALTPIETPNAIAKEANPAYVPTDEYYSSQQGISMNHIGNIEDVWDYYKGDDIRVAVIDSGFDFDHPDFTDDNGRNVFSLSEGKMFSHATPVSGKAGYYTIDPNNADGATTTVYPFVPQAQGYGYYINDVWYPQCNFLKPMSGIKKFNNHGTDVSSTIASAIHTTTNKGTVGIAPKITIIPIKVDFWTDCVYEALSYVETLNKNESTHIDVVNMSIEGPDYKDIYNNSLFDQKISSLINKKTIVVAAAGNSNTDAASYPASNTGVIGVGALARNSGTQKASFSNYNASNHTSSSNNNVDVVAPGYVYTATWDGSNAPYHETQGTSFSSPIVAGAAALWKEANKTGSVSEFKTDLFNSCIDIGASGWDTTFGYGRLAVDKLLGLGTDVNDVVLDSESSVTIEVEETSQISAHVLPVSATDQDLEYELYYKNGVCSVDSNGLITGLSQGSEMVWVYSHENHDYAAIVYVTVNPSSKVHVTGVELSTHSATLDLSKSETLQLEATVTPSNATDKSVEWLSDDENVATVDSNGLVTAVGVGTTQIGVFTNDGTHDDYCEITVVEYIPPTPVVTSVIITPPDGQCNVDMKDGNTIQLTAIVNGTDLTDTSVTWFSTNSNYGTVDSNGLVTVKQTGYVDITARSNQDTSKSATRRVYITNTTPKVNSVTLDKESARLVLANSETVQLNATVNVTYDAPQTVTWETSDSSVATVVNGLVTPKSVGTATITARSTFDTTKYATCTITVVQNNSVRYESTARDAAQVKTGSAPAGSSVTFYNSYNNASQITGSNSQTWTFTGYDGYTIAAIRLNLKRTNTTSGTITITITNNSKNVATPTKTYNSITTTATDYDIYTTPFEVDGVVVINVAASVNSIYCYELEFDVDESSLREIDHLTAIYSGGDIKYNTDFDSSNLVVRAYYDSVEYKTLSSNQYELSGFDKTKEGEQAITVSYRNKTTTFNVNVVYYDVSYLELTNIKDTFNVGDDFIKPIVTAVYEDQTSAVVTNSCVFTNNSTASAGAFNVGVSYTEHGVTKTTSYGILVKESGTSEETGEILFGNTAGRTNVNSSSVNGLDSLNNSWTITTSGTTSFTPNASYSQIGSKNNPASSVQLTMSFSSSTVINSVSFSCGGFSGSDGSVTIKVGQTTIGTGNIPDSSSTTINSNKGATGTSITITITDIKKGIYISSISYNIGEDVEPTDLEKAQQFAVEFSNSVVCYGGSKAPTFVTGKSWAGLSQTYNSLSATIKAYFQVETPSDSAILDAVLKHDQLVKKYSYVDFMGRTQFNASLQIKPNIISSFNGTTIVIIASVIGLTALGGYIFIRRRKEN